MLVLGAVAAATLLSLDRPAPSDAAPVGSLLALTIICAQMAATRDVGLPRSRPARAATARTLAAAVAVASSAGAIGAIAGGGSSRQPFGWLAAGLVALLVMGWLVAVPLVRLGSDGPARR